MKKKCEHQWQIFRDVAVVGYLTFYCRKCLLMIKKKRPESYEVVE